MVEAVTGTRRAPALALHRPSLAESAGYVLPVGMAVLCVVALILTVQRAGLLRSWSDDYGGSGNFLVESCDEARDWGADQWSCTGILDATDLSASMRSDLVTSLGANASSRPYVGQRFDVFFDPDDRSEVYPVEYRLNELLRLYLSMLPRLLLFVGSLLWLTGWAFTRRLDPEDFITRDSIRLPQRFSWKSTGVRWIALGVLVIGLNYVLTTRVIGSLGVV